jgi:hypothetical protein
LNARSDASSPIATVGGEKIGLNLMSGWGHYDKLVKSLTIRLIRDHPLYVLCSVYEKVSRQIASFGRSDALAPRNLAIPITIVGVAALACGVAGGMARDRGTALHSSIALVIVLSFAALTPVLTPAYEAVGTLFSYLAALVIVICYVVTILVGRPKLRSVTKQLLIKAS